MYRLPPFTKSNPVLRWRLPDKVFFACGACHVLAHAFLEAYPAEEARVVWLSPDDGFTGNHIFVATDRWIFDYHGYSRPDRYLAHAWRKARRWWPGWNATQVELPREVLVSEERSRAYEGLWLREPRQFLHDAMPRAEAYLRRFPPPPERA